MFLRVMSSSLEASGLQSLIFTVIARLRELARSEIVVISKIFIRNIQNAPVDI